MRRLLVASFTSVVFASMFAPAARADGPEVTVPAAPEAGSAERAKWHEHLGDLTFVFGYENGMKAVQETGRPPLYFFTTTWCGWCKKLASESFKDADAVAALSGYTLILVDGDVEKDVTKKYGVRGYPALVVADAAGGEIDRIVGYRPVEAFQAEMARIQRGERTLPALTKTYAETGEIDVGIELGAKLAVAHPEEAVALFAELASKANEKDKATQGKVSLEYAAALLEAGKRDDAAAEGERLVRDFADTPSAGAAATRVGRAFLALDAGRALAFLGAVRAVATDPKDKAAVENLTISVHKAGIAAALKRQAAAAGDDPQALNAVAWTCFEQKMNVREAVGWAKTAVEKSNRDPMILDTLANLLWLSGARDDAIKTEAEAAAKVEGPQKTEFEALVAKWTAEQEAMKAKKAVPMTPVVPPAAK